MVKDTELDTSAARRRVQKRLKSAPILRMQARQHYVLPRRRVPRRDILTMSQWLSHTVLVLQKRSLAQADHVFSRKIQSQVIKLHLFHLLICVLKGWKTAPCTSASPPEPAEMVLKGSSPRAPRSVLDGQGLERLSVYK